MIRTCEICGRSFEGRSDARFCSATCRKRNQRNTTIGTIEKAEAYAVRHAHSTATDLSRLAKIAPAPRCLAYRDIAEAIEGKLEEIGL